MNKAISLPIIKVNKLNQWLDSKVNDKDIWSKHEVDEYTIKPYKSHYNKNAYYTENDSDVSASDKVFHQLIDDMGDDLTEDMKLHKLSMYDDHIMLNPNTNRYHSNLLFRQLIDFSHDNNHEYAIYNTKYNEHIDVNLMDVSLKESFYKFCKDNS